MFTTGIDIANRALQYVGATRISSFDDNSKQAAETGFVYPLIRQAELRRSVWRCALRRAVLRPIASGTKRFIPPTWEPGLTYAIGAIVQDATGVYWVCMVDNTADVNNAPGLYTPGTLQFWQQYFGPVYGDSWDPSISYYAGEMVYTAGGPDTWTISLTNGNLNNATNDAANWSPSVDASDLPINFLVAAGPSVTINGKARNLFPLPYGYLRVTNPDPKVGSTATNTVSAGLRFNDWEFESNYIVSAQTDPILLRFVADLSDVTMLDPLLCEAISARVGYSICETLTQSNIKLQAIGSAYQKFMHDARVVNLIETGSTEPEEEPYLLTRGPAGVVDTVASGGNQNAGSPEG